MLKTHSACFACCKNVCFQTRTVMVPVDFAYHIVWVASSQISCHLSAYTKAESCVPITCYASWNCLKYGMISMPFETTFAWKQCSLIVFFSPSLFFFIFMHKWLVYDRDRINFCSHSAWSIGLNFIGIHTYIRSSQRHLSQVRKCRTRAIKKESCILIYSLSAEKTNSAENDYNAILNKTLCFIVFFLFNL